MEGKKRAFFDEMKGGTPRPLRQTTVNRSRAAALFTHGQERSAAASERNFCGEKNERRSIVAGGKGEVHRGKSRPLLKNLAAGGRRLITPWLRRGDRSP